ncbi:DEAD/DEAH box helicase [Streptomonospora sediminis]
MATDATETAPGFADLPLREELLDALVRLGYEEPTPIQREAIPPLVQGRDLLGQAATGTGKTAAFALPILERMERDRSAVKPMAMVLVPTRELAMQVSEAVHRYGRDQGVRLLPVYGGQPIGRQVRGLERGVDIIVATPGRALDHLGRGTLKLDELQMAVLDEADEMFDMGFAEDIDTILEEIPKGCQTVMFSATMPPRIEKMAGGSLNDPVRIQIARETRDVGEAPLVRQTAYVVPRAHKPAAIGRLLDVEAPTASIVFCRTREEVDQLSEVLNGRGHRAEALHGGMSQEQRDRTMGRLRSGATDLVVATDVAARGLDVEHLTHVINFNVPSAPDSYVHRVGRVGRAGREGVAITLVEPREHRMLKTIRRATDYTITVQKIPTIADIRARRLELTTASLRETLLDDDAEDDREHFRVVVETLADEFDVMEVALASVKIAHEAQNPVEDQEEIPEVSLKPEQKDKTRGARREGGGRREQRGSTGGGERREQPGGRAPAGGMARLFIGAGRGAKVRPQDLVGAITGESELRGRDIGHIEITERFSLVEVPSDAAEDVIAALKNTTIKGRKAVVRRDAKEKEKDGADGGR